MSRFIKSGFLDLIHASVFGQNEHRRTRESTVCQATTVIIVILNGTIGSRFMRPCRTSIEHVPIVASVPYFYCQMKFNGIFVLREH